MIDTTVSAPPKCDANSNGRAASDWGETFLPCQTRRGLRSFTDRQGVTRFHCAALGHRENVVRRFGRYVSEVDSDPLTAAKARDELLAGTAYFDSSTVSIEWGRHIVDVDLEP